MSPGMIRPMVEQVTVLTNKKVHLGLLMKWNNGSLYNGQMSEFINKCMAISV